MLRFGTDGLRGVANSELTPELVLALGRAAARVLVLPGAAPGGSATPQRPSTLQRPATPGRPVTSGDALPADSPPAGVRPRRCLIGRDTRLSGPLLAAALSAGLASEGVDVVDLGVIPTPGVAALSERYHLPAAMISASHNPFADNGIKLFAAGGRKLARETEEALEAALEALLPGANLPGAPAPAGVMGDAVGRLSADPGAVSWYRGRLLAGLEGRRLGGIRVVVDCGHGAAVVTAPQVLADAGADVAEVIGASPDGTNINAGCGSTAPQALAASVVAHRADVGLAFDGDADRVIAVDGWGEVVDGDRLLALFAADLDQRGRLASRTVVVTVMTNLGFHQAMSARGISVHTTAVGDRSVLEALDLAGWSLGGEQSGHLIFHDLATTGDGVLSGLLLLDLLVRAGRSLADLAEGAMQRVPQVLRNVVVDDPDRLRTADAVWKEVSAVEESLGGTGRVLLRPSGTEPLVRVMVEAPTDVQAEEAAGRIAAAVEAAMLPEA